MTEGFELVGTLTMRTDDKGYLDIVTHIDKTSNSSAPSNRDFYFEVAYKENPDILVAASNTLTIRHLVPGNPEITLTTDKTEVVGNDKSILTVKGTDFLKNVSLTIKLYRKIGNPLASIIETKNVVTDEKGEFSIEIHQNYGNAAVIPSLREFHAEASLTDDNKNIITSNIVKINHIAEREFRIMTRTPNKGNYIDYSEEENPPRYNLPKPTLIQDWWSENPQYSTEAQPPFIANFKMVDTQTGNIPTESNLDVKWQFRYWLGIEEGFWSSYYYNWPGFEITNPEEAKQDMGNPANWNIDKTKYLVLDGFPIEIAEYSLQHADNWHAFLEVKLFIDNKLIDTETIPFYLPPQV